MGKRFLMVPFAMFAVLLMTPLPVAGQATAAPDAWTAPRTSDGQPDMQGVWANNNVTPLQRPIGLADRAFLSDEEVERLKANAANLFGSDAGDAAFGDQFFVAALSDRPDFESTDGGTGNYNQFWLVERDFDNRTSLITDPPDGKIPALTPRAEQAQSERAAYRRNHPADSWEDRGLSERCVNFGIPKLGAGYNSYSQIVQTPGYVVMFHEMAHDVRVIPLDGRAHIEEDIRQWNGDPRGRWEGDTLVVETTNFSASSNRYMGSAGNLHLVERFTRVGPQTLNYEVTLTDPTTWTRPWTALIPLRKSEDAIYEYACHEGNYGMVGILAGHRAQEKAAEDSTTKTR